ncbi:EF-hand domain-containing protein [Coleofasciculus sp. F4-SAH-05]|uniref:EF-hand domain-containing protein n=1 Tax=Coleofasciculus sp. F4-SAH-05 TaxID=3069525 RepID=UPI0040641D37
MVGFVNQLFDLLDLDGNGVITIKEYKTILSSWNVSEDLAQETFPKLDSNGDGHISKEEFMELARQFHASDDPQAPGNWFLGSY